MKNDLESRLIKVIRKESRKMNPHSPHLAYMETDTTINYGGLKITKDEYNLLDINKKRIHTASSSDGAGITITEKIDNNLQKGDIVLIMKIDDDVDDERYIVFGKVV